jgi:23S rRNA (uracil1939-C5)-methyltransferase
LDYTSNPEDSRFSEQQQSADGIRNLSRLDRDLEINSGKTAANIRTVKGSAEDFLRSLNEAPELIVSDPPRAGLGKQATSELLRLSPQELVLVSCDPATLSRDLTVLPSRYEITRLAMVDLFPQTYHFETVAHLSLK